MEYTRSARDIEAYLMLYDHGFVESGDPLARRLARQLFQKQKEWLSDSPMNVLPRWTFQETVFDPFLRSDQERAAHSSGAFRDENSEYSRDIALDAKKPALEVEIMASLFPQPIHPQLFEKLETLRTLKLAHFDREVLGKLKLPAHLTHLDLLHEKLTDDCLRVLFNQQQIERLNLSSRRRYSRENPKLSIKALGELGAWGNLRHLSMTHLGIDNQTLGRIVQSAKLESLALDESSTISSKGLCALANCPSLRSLSLE
ncbi:MAG: hypothetical protein P1V97_31050, partial [Planctomycetota bacterium]|nr:hypothetical protein [Planctomycetota bacterium]